MYFQDQHLANLAAKARAGDSAAVTGFRQELEPQLRHIVRRVVRTGSGRSPLARRILAEVARTVPPGWHAAGADQEEVVVQVARRLCAVACEQLQVNPSSSARETVLCY